MRHTLFSLGRARPAAVRFSAWQQPQEDGEDTSTTGGPLWPDLFRGPSAHGLDPWAPTSSSLAVSLPRKTWMAGTSPAKAIFSCIKFTTDDRRPGTGQPWIKSGHDQEATAAGLA